jgi:hypothetical protein
MVKALRSCNVRIPNAPDFIEMNTGKMKTTTNTTTTNTTTTKKNKNAPHQHTFSHCPLCEEWTAEQILSFFIFVLGI